MNYIEPRTIVAVGIRIFQTWWENAADAHGGKSVEETLELFLATTKAPAKLSLILTEYNGVGPPSYYLYYKELSYWIGRGESADIDFLRSERLAASDREVLTNFVEYAGLDPDAHEIALHIIDTGR